MSHATDMDLLLYGCAFEDRMGNRIDPSRVGIDSHGQPFLIEDLVSCAPLADCDEAIVVGGGRS